ncbi:MAG: hypothetical protein AAGI13_02930 [Pseudomonadota bacterium]
MTRHCAHRMAAWLDSRRKGAVAASALLIAGLSVIALPGAAQAQTRPGLAWGLNGIDIVVAEDADLALRNPTGDNNDALSTRVSGVVRSGLRQATRGYFIGERRTRLIATVRQFRGISNDTTLLTGGRMQGEIDFEIRDAATGEVLARQTGVGFTRRVSSGLFAGSSQQEEYIEEVALATRGWMSGLGCADAACSFAGDPLPASGGTRLALAPAPRPAAPPPQPAPEPEPVIIEPEAVEPEIVVEEAVEENEGGGFFSGLASVFDGGEADEAPEADNPALEIAEAEPEPQPIPEPVLIEPEPEIAAIVPTPPEAEPPEPVNEPEIVADEPGEDESGGFFGGLASVFDAGDAEESDEPEPAAAEIEPDPVPVIVEPEQEPEPELEIAAVAPIAPAPPSPPELEITEVEPVAEPAQETGSEEGGFFSGLVSVFAGDEDQTAEETLETAEVSDAADIPEPEVESQLAALSPPDAPAVQAAPRGIAGRLSAPLPLAAPRGDDETAETEPEPTSPPEEESPVIAELTPAAAPAPPVAPEPEETAPVIVADPEVAVEEPAAPDPVVAAIAPVLPIPRPPVEAEPEPDPNQIAVAPDSPQQGASEETETAALTPPSAEVSNQPSAGGALPVALALPSQVESAPDVVAPEPAPRPEPEPEAEPPAVVALANPARVPSAEDAPASQPLDLAPVEPVAPSEPLDPVELPEDGTLEVDTQIAAVDPNAAGPTLANAQWIGFTPAVFGRQSDRPGLWIAGPFDRRERQGWITDTATGSTTRVTFIWREAAPGSQALLSAEAARALGLTPGDVANVAVYLPR